MAWVRQVRIGKSGKPHGEILEVPDCELPDGVGFPTRKACKDFYRRQVNQRPIWLLPE
jgi:hypothetical protein